MTVVAPPAGIYQRVGFVHVVVHGRGTSVGFVFDRFHYLPDITALNPAGGPTAGGTSVAINGHGLTGARTVTFGTVPAASFRVVSDTQILAVTPALAPGAIDVRVNVPGGTTARHRSRSVHRTLTDATLGRSLSMPFSQSGEKGDGELA